MTRLKLIAPTLIAAVLIILWAGCPGPSTPRITLTATDCEKDKIAINASKTIGGRPNNYVVNVSVTITCDGQPLPNAEIKFTSWLADTVKLTTDAQGKAPYSRRIGTSARPTGPFDVTVEVEGSDGTKTESVTV